MDAVHSVVDIIDDMEMDFIEMFRDNTVVRERIDPFNKYDETQFKKKYRFSKDFAQKILDLVKDDLRKDARGRGITPEIQVACALRHWARHQIQDDSGDMHGISQQSVSKLTKRVAEALARHAPTFINMPNTIEEEQEVIRGFRAIANFPTVVGAIDCTHVRIKRVGGANSAAYVNRKGYFSLNIQVVCDSHLKIRDIVARWRGSAHDSRIFNESLLKEKFERGEFHGRLLGDSGYACTPYLFTPLLNPSTDKEEAYNRAHIRTRNTIEICFGLWKQRFRCLLRGMYMNLTTAKATIVALAVLHNIAIDMAERMAIVRYVRHRRRSQTSRPTVRGSIIRQRFINQHF